MPLNELSGAESLMLTAAHAGVQRTRTVCGQLLTRVAFDAWSASGWVFQRIPEDGWWVYPPCGEPRLFSSLRKAVKATL